MSLNVYSKGTLATGIQPKARVYIQSEHKDLSSVGQVCMDVTTKDVPDPRAC